MSTYQAGNSNIAIPNAAMHAGLPAVLLSSETKNEVSVDDYLQELLASIRMHLEMEVAFIAEFSEGQRVFRYVEAPGGAPIAVDDSGSLEDSYCLRVVDGRLPEIIPDAHQNSEALSLPATLALPVRAHASVPIRLRDGKVYGTFCCFSTLPNPTLNDRDGRMMRIFAELAAKQIERKRASEQKQKEIRTRIENVLANDALTIVYQPIFDTSTGEVIGFEGLSRFMTEPKRTPDIWFNEAAAAGLGVQLEILAIKKLLVGLPKLPQNIYVSLNVSPDTVISGELEKVLDGMPFERIVLEITEHSFIQEYLNVDTALKPLRQRGLRVAVDDAGAGYASFRHILKLAPDIIKLDISLTRDIDKVRAERALASALIRFAQQTGSSIISEGIETEAEMHTLQQLGVTKMQGFLLGRPMALADALAICRGKASVSLYN